MIKEFFERIIERVKRWFGKGEAEQSPEVPATQNPAASGQVEDVREETRAPAQQPSRIAQAYADIKTPANAEAEAGLQVLNSYPGQFQATEFPALAGNGEAKMLGNNQAFFFVNNPKGNTDPANMTLDTTQLETLMRNVRENNTRFTLMVDADVMDNRERFVEKYSHLRREERADAQALLGREAEIISEFVASDGIRETAKKVINEGKSLSETVLTVLVDKFLEDNFRLKGVQTETALDAAVWQVDAPEGALVARQTYAPSTENTDRSWRIGTQPEIEQLAQRGNEDADVLQKATAKMNGLPKRDLLPQQGQQREQTPQR